MQGTRRGGSLYIYIYIYIYNVLYIYIMYYIYIYSILEGVCSSVGKLSLTLTVLKQALKCLIPSKCSKLSEKE